MYSSLPTCSIGAAAKKTAARTSGVYQRDLLGSTAMSPFPSQLVYTSRSFTYDSPAKPKRVRSRAPTCEDDVQRRPCEHQLLREEGRHRLDHRREHSLPPVSATQPALTADASSMCAAYSSGSQLDSQCGRRLPPASCRSSASTTR
ncbi:DUF3683 domain-containing protein [Babesia caballi]|uniref:DUF3683 domain-containing protein n=1 Tax=Babesia caballi TaxID=5871 RepID=A0AAV4LR70_BABCB|nr:DUF3683 domain-containing protein [Babesia caballi]